MKRLLDQAREWSGRMPALRVINVLLRFNEQLGLNYLVKKRCLFVLACLAEEAARKPFSRCARIFKILAFGVRSLWSDQKGGKVIVCHLAGISEPRNRWVVAVFSTHRCVLLVFQWVRRRWRCADLACWGSSDHKPAVEVLKRILFEEGWSIWKQSSWSRSVLEVCGSVSRCMLIATRLPQRFLSSKA